jgi:hypothetical protein
MDIRKLIPKISDSGKLPRDINKSEASKWKEFLNWFELALNEGKLHLFFRGNDKDSLRARLRPQFLKSAGFSWMNAIFELGEKPKKLISSADDDFVSGQTFILDRISDLSPEALERIFKEIALVLENEPKYRKKIEQRKPSFLEYFNEKANIEEFTKRILSLEYLQQFDARNYYLRILHTIYSLGRKNKHSIFVSLSSVSNAAEQFTKSENGILILYWLPAPIRQFGFDNTQVFQVNSILETVGLPTLYFNFFQHQEEFSAIGGLFPGQIIGYLDATNFIINPNLVAQSVTFDDHAIETGFQDISISEHKNRIENISLYNGQIQLTDNLFFGEDTIK